MRHLILAVLAFLLGTLLPVTISADENIIPSNIGQYFKLAQTMQYTESLKRADFNIFFNKFKNYYNPSMNVIEANKLADSIWQGCNSNYKIAIYFAAMCNAESSLRVKKNNPEVKNRTDYCGAHYNLLFAELHRENQYNGPYDAKYLRKCKDPLVLKWKKYLVNNPNYGTLLGARWFTNVLVPKRGLIKAIREWNQGSYAFNIECGEPYLNLRDFKYFRDKQYKSKKYLFTVLASLADFNQEAYALAKELEKEINS